MKTKGLYMTPVAYVFERQIDTAVCIMSGYNGFESYSKDGDTFDWDED